MTSFKTTMSWLLGLALCAGLAHAAPSTAPAANPSAPPEARMVAASSEVTFTARQLGVPLEGRFKRFDARIALDPRQPQTGRVQFQIELGSVSIDPETDAELLKPEWFGAARFPRAQFVSRAIRATGPGQFEVAGTLTLKGIARELVVPVRLTSSPAGAVASGAFTLKRLDFKIGDGDWADPSVVAHDVQVRFKLTLQGLPAL